MFGWFKRRNERPSGGRYLNQALSAASYRANMDRITQSNKLKINAEGGNRLLSEAVEVTCLVITRSVEDTGRTMSTLHANERGVVGVLAMVASDHMSRVADVSFELTTVAVFARLFLAHLDEATVAAELSNAGSSFNALSTDPVASPGIAKFGALVAKFFSTGENLYLKGTSVLMGQWLQENASAQ